MGSIYEHVNQANSLIENADLPHPSGALLLSFVAEALDPRRAADYVLETCQNTNTETRTQLLALVNDWTYIVDQISKRGSVPPAPDASERRQIIARDGSRCCITGKPARLGDPLFVDYILPVPSGWTDAAAQHEDIDRPRLLTMLAAFFGPGYRDWWLNYARNPDQFTSPLYNHWLVSRSASLAFRRGHVTLQRRQSSMIEYSVCHTSIGPDQPIPLDGDQPLLGDHSRTGILTVDARFIGTHARLAKSIQLVQLAAKFSSSPSSVQSRGRDNLLKSRWWSWTFSPTTAQMLLTPFLTAWLFVPAQVRELGYRALGKAARRFLYDPEASFVQKLPFGLYLKSTDRNEYNAMLQVRKYTSIPVPKPLDFVCHSSSAEDQGYLLMTRVPGFPLASCHQLLSDNDSAHITSQLQDYVAQLRNIPKTAASSSSSSSSSSKLPAGGGKSDHSGTTAATSTICNTLGGPLTDPRINFGQPSGPFADEHAFNTLGMLRFADDPARSGHSVMFTHADLNPRNIMVQQDGSSWRVTGIVDWETAGYFPEYWEYTKAMYEGFRWPRRYGNMVRGVFGRLGDYEKEFAVEKRSWEAGM